MANDQLRLIALDEQDLEVVSSHLQDAVVRVGEMAYVPSQKRFAAILNRFNWEKATKTAANENERRRTALRFDRVLGAQIKSLRPSASDRVLSLLAEQAGLVKAGNATHAAELMQLSRHSQAVQLGSPSATGITSPDHPKNPGGEISGAARRA